MKRNVGSRGVFGPQTGGKLEDMVRALPERAEVLDYGCFGFDLHKRASALRGDLRHYAADFKEPDTRPEGVEFGLLDYETSRTVFEDDSFDFVVASHVIEHVQNPTVFFQELMRICKPGGLAYIESPSDNAALVKSDPDYRNRNFFSFWDDPTHVRPWSPAAFYRLALSFGCELQDSRYIGGIADKVVLPFARAAKAAGIMAGDITPYVWRANRWACYGAFRKPEGMRGAPGYGYVSLKPD
ncbi:bifunctional 2-polyprenyl-6-hydroxyphenol methylase/3-demethylubiquinol 3-O-methyltransferase UbiG [Poseidonocella sp. HB161398]|uniref:class I SAM-dependent methyltransferase n=1 Tax=Poseidonocella sp. HB161398 TaxID=2320855 RepID=UPI001980B9A8|nr:class I SAM-dependent methyltransferase [Poseidonocella sp. HB161398]